MVQIENYSLKAIRQELSRARDTSVSDITITVTFSSPGNPAFKHNYTLEDVDSLEELREEVEETEEIAERRIRGVISGADERDETSRSFQEVKETKTIEEPPELRDFRETKQSIERLEEAKDKTRSVYDRVDRGRTQRIQSSLSDSPSLDAYLNRIEGVDSTLDFENTVGETAWETGRRRLSGDTTWMNQNGQPVRTLIFERSVTFQVGGPGGEEIEFDDKSEAREYFENNKIA